jgi:hypothetical protein
MSLISLTGRARPDVTGTSSSDEESSDTRAAAPPQWPRFDVVATERVLTFATPRPG